MGLTRINHNTMPSGSVLQVKQMTTSTETSITGTTYTDTAFTLSITPKATTSKILVIWESEVTMTGDGSFDMRLRRGTTEVFKPFNDAINFGSSNQHGMGFSFNYLDSPATTSSVTYTVQASEGGSGTFKLPSESGKGSLTLMEIAG
jgi:hypothetical protein